MPAGAADCNWLQMLLVKLWIEMAVEHVFNIAGRAIREAVFTPGSWVPRPLGPLDVFVRGVESGLAFFLLSSTLCLDFVVGLIDGFLFVLWIIQVEQVLDGGLNLSGMTFVEDVSPDIVPA